MKAEQLYFTSCEHGYDNSPGFQVKAISQGFEYADAEEVKKIGTYIIPRNFSDLPTREEIETHFPIAFRYKKSGDNKFLIARSVYVGKDYAGERPGNYFMHGLVINGFLDKWPIDLYTWSDWKKEDHTKSVELPQATIDDILSIDIQEYTTNKNDQSLLSQMLQAIFLSRHDDRKLVIRVDNKSDSLKWLTLVTKAFPLKVSQEISFSSYQYDPGSCMDINIVMGETDFLFDSNEKNYHFYVFDLVNEDQSHIEKHNKYPKVISKLIFEEKETLQDFYAFVEYFDATSLDDLENLLTVFIFSKGTEVDLSDKELHELLIFIVSKVKNDFADQLFKIFEPAIEKSIDNKQYTHLEQLVTFYIGLYKKTHNPNYENAIVEQIVTLYLGQLSNQFEKDRFQTLVQKLHADIPSYMQKYYSYLLQDNNLLLLKQISMHLSGDAFYDLINELKLAFRDQDNFSNMSENDYLISLIMEYLRYNCNRFPWKIIHLFPDIEEQSAIIFILMKEMEELGETDTSLIQLAETLKVFYAEETTSYYDLIQKLCQYEVCWPLLQYDFKYRIDGNVNRIHYFSEYQSVIFEHNNDFRSHAYDDFIGIYWNALTNSERKIQAFGWVQSGEVVALYNSNIIDEIWVSLYNVLSFDMLDKESKKIEELIEKYRNDINIEVVPNKFLLRSFIFERDNSLEIDEIYQHLEKLEPDDYLRFLKSYMTKNIKDVVTIENYASLIKNSLVPQHKHLFVEFYCKNYYSDRDILKRIEELSLRFWLSVTVNDNSIYSKIRGEMIDCLKQRLSYLSDDALEQLQTIKDMPPQQKRKLSMIIEDILEKRQTKIQKIADSMKNTVKSLSSFWRKK